MSAAGGRWRSRLAVLGGLLALAALGWTLWRTAGQAGSLLADMSWRLAAVLAVGSLLYAALGLLQATAWWWLTGLHGDRLDAVPTVALWSRAQLAKYLPGNVFHYVARHLMGHRMGLRHQTLVASHLLEMFSQLLAAALLAGVSLALTGLPGTGGSEVAVGRWLILVGLAGLALVGWPLVERLGRRLPWLGPRLAEMPHLGWRANLGRVVPSLLLHLAFFAATASLLPLIDLGWRGVGLDWDRILGVYALAWSFGVVTPGAPGGLGVREAVLTFGLERLTGLEPAYAASIALALRLVTTLGDGLLYLAASRVPEPEEVATGEQAT